jgi:hypothetical protein
MTIKVKDIKKNVLYCWQRFKNVKDDSAYYFLVLEKQNKMTRDEFVYYELTTLDEIGKIHFVEKYPETELLIEKLL